MRITVIAVVVALATGTGFGLGYDDTFQLPDGSFPAEWIWTGDPRGEGSFLVYDEAFTHVTGGSVYYYRVYRGGGRPGLGAHYDFQVRGANWIFAWRITPWDSSSGRCLWLSHDDLSRGWGYTFAEFSWEVLDPVQYPDGAYMWHNGTVLRSAHYPTAGPLEGWHWIHIDDSSETSATVVVDGEEIFTEPYEYIVDGYQGLGCVADGEMTPAFNLVCANWPDPVEQTTWGLIKALFRWR